MSAKWKISLIGVVFAAFISMAGAGPVSYYGKLQTRGNKLVGSKTGDDKTVQLRGVSLGWSNTGWETSRFFTENTVNAMVDQWKAEIIRTPLGIGGDGYFNPAPSPGIDPNAGAAANKARVELAIDAALAKDVYVIIDWHSHTAHGNAQERTLAKAFFKEMAEKYGDRDNIIFEVYNEPTNTSTATWANIKNYAEEVIAEIRQHSNNLVLVGTRSWCQHVDDVAADGAAINDDNVAYVLHFYAHSHRLANRIGDAITPTFRDAALSVINKNLPLFVSEWGTTHSDGGNPTAAGPGGTVVNNFNTHNEASSNEWMAFLDSLRISSAAWNVNNKHEGSAFFKNPNHGGHPWNSTTNSVPNWPVTHFTDTNAMTASGLYIYNLLNKYAETAEWRNSSTVTRQQVTARPDQTVTNRRIVRASKNGQLNVPPGAKVYSLDGRLVAHRKVGDASMPVLGRNGVFILKMDADNIKIKK